MQNMKFIIILIILLPFACKERINTLTHSKVTEKPKMKTIRITLAQINLEDNATPPYSSSQWGGKIRSEATNWSITPVTTGTVYNWAEMASHLQQVVNRAGWSSGNAVLLLFEEATYTKTINYHATGWGALNQGYAYPTLTVSWREYP